MLVLFVLTIVIGFVLGLATGGNIAGLVEIRLQWPGLVLFAAATQLALPLVTSNYRPLVLCASFVGLGVWLIQSRSAPPGMRLAVMLLAAGIVMNAAVITANGSMPVSRDAVHQSGMPALMSIAKGHHYKHHFSDRTTGLRWLSDVIPLRPLRSVLSPGDLAMLAGIALLVSAGTRSGLFGQRRARPARVVRVGRE